MGKGSVLGRGLLACFVVACAAVLPSCSKGTGVGTPAPNFTLPSIDGRQVSLSDFKGQVVAMNLFAHW